MGEEAEKSQVDNEELLTRLRKLENKVNLLKKNNLVTAEDQLFFGVIISFFILFVTLPMNELIVFLQNSFIIPYDSASIVAQSVRYLGITLLLISAITRYYAVIGNQLTSKKYRYISLEFFIFAFASILTMVLVNLISALSFLTYTISVPLTLLILTLIFYSLNRLEIKILQFYSDKNITAKRYSFPIASLICLSYVFGNCVIVFLLQVTIMCGITHSGILQQIEDLWLIFSILFALVYYLRWFKIKPHKDSDYYKLKSYIQSLRRK